LRENFALLRRQGDRQGMAIVLGGLGMLEEDPHQAVTYHEESLALCREVRDREGQAIQLTWWAAHLLARGAMDRGLTLLAEARVIARARTGQHLLVRILGSQGMLLARHGLLRPARSLLDEDVALARALADRAALIAALQLCAAVARAQGEYAAAQAMLMEALTLLRGEHRHQEQLSTVFVALGQIEWETGDLDGATAHTLEGKRLAVLLDDVELCRLALETQALIAWARGNLVEAARLCGEALDAGRTVSIQTGESLAGMLTTMGLIATSRGEVERAHTHLTEGLRRAATANARQTTLACLDRLAGLAAVQGNHVRAARLFGASAALSTAMGAVFSPALSALRGQAIAAVRTALGDDAFATAWSDGRSMSLDQAVATALAVVHTA
jgi:ATP/maltotriose-dependent transcriptional regulator MalT